MAKMPVLFIGHGSPMNAIEDNEYTSNWIKIAKQIPKPQAILAISAHWYTAGTRISEDENPKVVYDMYGFPKELYDIVYNSKGAPALASMTKNMISREVVTDNTWGYDHGTWSVLCRMYPDADIPVYQLSVDRNADAKIHYQIGKELTALREQGVLIFASGNVVHNLMKVQMDLEGGYPWAEEFDAYIKDKIVKKKHKEVIDYHQAGNSAGMAVPIQDHFYPLLYALGASRDEDLISIFNDSCVFGSLSMTSYLFS